MEDNKRHKEFDDLFSSLPLPDEDRAWQDMKARLEKDDDDRFIVLPPFLQGCSGWTLLLALFLGGALLFFFLGGRESKELKSEAGQVHQPGKVDTRRDSVSQSINITSEEGAGLSQPVSTVAETAPATKKEGSNKDGFETGLPTLKTRERSVEDDDHEEKSPGGSKASGKKIAITGNDAQPNVFQASEGTINNEGQRVMGATLSNRVGHTPSPADSIGRRPDTASLKPAVADSVQNALPKKQDQKRKYHLGGGIALQQQVPFDGQEWTPYNYRGRKGSLADYIPSVYLRLYREQKWFLQGEFRYGAPQYTREFVYSKEVKTDTFGIRSTTSYRLKKTYYHQLPLSVNFYVRPSWSVGTGMVYNRFYGAVSDRELRMGTTAFTDTVVSKELVLDKNESLFRSTNLQWLLETQYRWKRWSAGGRFTQGLQPYIEYVDEQGQEQRERNHSLQLFIRYELWSTKQK